MSGPFEALMEAAVDAIIIIDSEGVIRRFNPAAQSMFGYPDSEVIGRNVRMLMPEPHRTQHDAYLANYHQTGEARIIGIGRETSGQRSDGSVFPMQLSVGEIRRGAAKTHYVGIVRDLSEQEAAKKQVRQLEEQLLHADRLVILGELTAGIAHEINQPLTAIAAYADAGRNMAEREAESDPTDIRAIYERIGQQARRAGEVVQRLRKMVRTGTLSKTNNDINQIIRNILLLFEYELKQTGIELELFQDNEVEPLYLDDVQVQQILVNLVKNGIDAITDSGMEAGRIEIRVSHTPTDVTVAVSDNGPGVPADKQRKLFEPFFTTKPKGVGLGLSICKNIAAAHGGSLRYTDRPEGGSCFTLHLPREVIG